MKRVFLISFSPTQYKEKRTEVMRCKESFSKATWFMEGQGLETRPQANTFSTSLFLSV